ncbi:glycosyltransferase family 39 protein [Streptomyces mobaraensis]|uniref:glycosyltransferase family 39 protein n=1 Tax=Streptomyces mobaraensis TaxID=35621 RepID=UPI0033EB98A2
MTTTSPDTALSRPAPPSASAAGRARWTRVAGWAAPVVAFVLGVWGNTRPSAWTDEIVTIDVARRSWPELLDLLGRVDAVHGLHYTLMYLVGRANGGLNEFTARVPSAMAVATAVAGLVWLGRLLGGPRLGLCAGLLLAVLPTASRYAQEARSFAFVMAVAVLATGALVKALAGRPGQADRPRKRWLAGYALLIALLGWFNVIGLLLVAAHAVTVALRRPGRRVTVRLLGAQAAGIAAVVPLLVLGSAQSSAVGEAAPVTAGTPVNYFTWLLTPGQDDLPADPALLRERLDGTLRVWHITCTHLSSGAREAAARTTEAQERLLSEAGFSPALHHSARGVDITLEQRPGGSPSVRAVGARRAPAPGDGWGSPDPPPGSHRSGARGHTTTLVGISQGNVTGMI